MKHLLLILLISSVALQIDAQDLSTSGAWSPNPVALPSTPTLNLRISNNCCIDMAVGNIEVSVAFPVGVTPSAPVGTGMTWILVGNTYFGSSNSILPDDSFWDFTFATAVTVANTYVATVNSSYTPGGDPNPSNNGSTPSVVVTGPLPITLADFHAKTTDCSVVQINWRTETESFNNYMEVEKSTNGSLYRSIGRVDGKNNPTGASYQFVDDATDFRNGQKYYYRLRQVDYDGSVDYSKSITVQYGCPKNYIVQVFPNPTIDELNLSFSQEYMGKDLEIRIIDADGKQVKRFEYKELSSSVFNMRISELALGLYTVQIISDDHIDTKQFVKAY